MVPLFLFTVDIESDNANLSENTFRECISASIDGYDGWSARAVAAISVGRKREKGLSGLCTALIKLIQFELPWAKVSGELERYEFER